MGRTEEIRARWEFCTRNPTGPEHQPVSDIKYLLSRNERLGEGYRDIWRCDLCEPCRDVIRCVADEQFKEALEDSDEQD